MVENHACMICLEDGDEKGEEPYYLVCDECGTHYRECSGCLQYWSSCIVCKTCLLDVNPCTGWVSYQPRAFRKSVKVRFHDQSLHWIGLDRAKRQLYPKTTNELYEHVLLECNLCTRMNGYGNNWMSLVCHLLVSHHDLLKPGERLTPSLETLPRRSQLMELLFPSCSQQK